MVGLTGAILGVISSGALFAGSGSETGEQTPLRVEQEQQPIAAEAQPSVAAESALSAAVTFTPAAGVFTRDGQDQPAPVKVASIATSPEPPAPQAAAPGPLSSQGSPAAASGVAAPPEASAPPTILEQAEPPQAATAPAAEAEGEAASASLWSEDAVECPRVWVPGSAEAANAPADCPDAAAALPQLAAASPDQSALDEAAVERASEEAGLQFVARLPLPRPAYEPPPARPKTVTKAGAKRPADPPPNCGSKKRARWRYVDRVPTWYCR